MPEYVFDTTVLSNFAAVHRLDLLEGRYRGVVFTTLEVSNELRKGIKAGYAYLKPALQQIETISPSGWIRLLSPDSAVEHRLQSEFDQFLDAGEASCLALAISRGFTLVTDDLAARRLAQARDVPLTGTLGILIALVRDDALPLNKANAILTTMIQRRYRSPVDRLDELV
jgi:predicted nucleic acid-binding protein